VGNEGMKVKSVVGKIEGYGKKDKKIEYIAILLMLSFPFV